MTSPTSVVGTTVAPAMINDGNAVEFVGTVVPLLGLSALLVLLVVIIVTLGPRKR